jgi:hypothetical protein
MGAKRRPIGVWIVSCLFIAVGVVGLVHHFPQHMVFHQDDVWIELTELLALVAGIFMLLRHNWARWLAIAWIAFHVAISWPDVSKIAIHTLFLAAFAWLLFRADARQYFARSAP